MASYSDLTISIQQTLQNGTPYTVEQLHWLTPKRVRDLEKRLNLVLTGDPEHLYNNYALTYLTARTPQEFRFEAAVRSGNQEVVAQMLAPEVISDLLIDDKFQHLCDIATDAKAYDMVNFILSVMGDATSMTMGEEGLENFEHTKMAVADNMVYTAASRGEWEIVYCLLQDGADLEQAYSGVFVMKYVPPMTKPADMIAHLEQYAADHGLPNDNHSTHFVESMNLSVLCQYYYDKGGAEGMDVPTIMKMAAASGNLKTMKWAATTFGKKFKKSHFKNLICERPNIPFLNKVKAKLGSEAFRTYMLQIQNTIYLMKDLKLITYAHQNGCTDWTAQMKIGSEYDPDYVCLRAHCAKLMKDSEIASDNAMDD